MQKYIILFLLISTVMIGEGKVRITKQGKVRIVKQNKARVVKAEPRVKLNIKIYLEGAKK